MHTRITGSGEGDGGLTGNDATISSSLRSPAAETLTLGERERERGGEERWGARRRGRGKAGNAKPSWRRGKKRKFFSLSPPSVSLFILVFPCGLTGLPSGGKAVRNSAGGAYDTWGPFWGHERNRFRRRTLFPFPVGTQSGRAALSL